MFVDSHCHLSSPELIDRVPEIRAAMAQAKVDRALCICTTLEEFPQRARAWRPGTTTSGAAWASIRTKRTARSRPSTTWSPWRRCPRSWPSARPGLDYFRLEGRTLADMAWQRERFRVHIQAAKASGLPLVIHTRSASADTLALLREEEGGRAGGVFHCFTETAEVARAALDLGFYISFSGILTFKKAEDLRAVAAFVPLDRCLIETDSPYLAPMPFRGKVNTPANVPWVARQLAEIKGLPLEYVAAATSANFERLFKRVMFHEVQA